MNIYLLGGHGFIGCHVAELLLQKGHSVTVIDPQINYSDPELRHSEYQRVINDRINFLSKHSYTHICQDWSELALTDLPKPQVIINLASCPNAQLVNQQPQRFQKQFVNDILDLGNFCADWDIKLVYASSSMVYGNFQEPARTDQICQPTDLYGTFKLCGEHILNSLARHRGLRHVNLRPSAVYGPRDMTVRVISRYTEQLLTKGVIEVADPQSRVDFTYVEDLAEMIVRATESDLAIGHTLNVTRGRSRSLLEAAELVRNYFGQGDLRTVSGNGFYPKRGSLDRQETIAVLQYTASTDIEQGIVKYLDWVTKKR